MMSGHGPNPIFFNKKEIKIGRPEHSLTSNSLRAITSIYIYITYKTGASLTKLGSFLA